MSEFLAKRITMRFIRKFQIKEEDWDLYYLGIEVIVTTALTSLVIMAIGIALRNFFWICCFLTVFHEYSGLLRRISRKNQSAVLLCFDIVLSAFIWNDEGTAVSSGNCAEHSHYNRGSNGVCTFCEVCAGRKSEQENP